MFDYFNGPVRTAQGAENIHFHHNREKRGVAILILARPAPSGRRSVWITRMPVRNPEVSYAEPEDGRRRVSHMFVCDRVRFLGQIRRVERPYQDHIRLSNGEFLDFCSLPIEPNPYRLRPHADQPLHKRFLSRSFFRSAGEKRRSTRVLRVDCQASFGTVSRILPYPEGPNAAGHRRFPDIPPRQPGFGFVSLAYGRHAR